MTPVKKETPNVRLMTRKEYDSLAPTQKKFYDDLVESGRCRIVDKIESAVATPTAPKRHFMQRSTPPPPREDPVAPLKGKSVTVTLINSETLTGILKGCYLYEIDIDGVIVLKHAIATIRESS